MIKTLGYEGYVRIGRATDLLRVLEKAKRPMLIAHPSIGIPLKSNMGLIGRWIGYNVKSFEFQEKGIITAMDYAILNDWKKPQPIHFPSEQ